MRALLIYPVTENLNMPVLPGDDLFRPRFCLAPGLAGWLPETLSAHLALRPNRFG